MSCESSCRSPVKEFNSFFFFFLVLGFMDTLAEWSRCRPAKPMGSPRVGSNVDFKSAFVSDGGLNRES